MVQVPWGKTACWPHLDLGQQLDLGHILGIEEGGRVEPAGEGCGGLRDRLEAWAESRVLRPKVHGGQEGGSPGHRLQLHQVEKVDVPQPARTLTIRQRRFKPPPRAAVRNWNIMVPRIRKWSAPLLRQMKGANEAHFWNTSATRRFVRKNNRVSLKICLSYKRPLWLLLRDKYMIRALATKAELR